MADELEWVPATTASDYDGDWFLVALTDDVDGWAVVVTRPDGTELPRERPYPFSGGYYPAIMGRPAWDIDPARADGWQWRLEVDGRPVRTRGTTSGHVPEDDQ